MVCPRPPAQSLRRKRQPFAPRCNGFLQKPSAAELTDPGCPANLVGVERVSSTIMDVSGVCPRFGSRRHLKIFPAEGRGPGRGLAEGQLQ